MRELSTGLDLNSKLIKSNKTINEYAHSVNFADVRSINDFIIIIKNFVLFNFVS